MAWLFFISACCWLASLTEFFAQNSRKRAFHFCFVLLLLTAGLRNMGGTDYYVYEDDYTGFRSYDGNGLKAMFELGYTMSVQLGNWLSLSYNGFIFFLTFLSLLLVFKFYWKRSVYPLLSLLLYVGNFFLYYNMIALRQMLAIALFLYALYYFYESRYWKFFLVTLLGGSFHNSFLILLPACLFLRHFKPTLVNITFLLGAAVVIKGMMGSLFESIISAAGLPSLALRLTELSNQSGEAFSAVFFLKTLVIGMFIILNRKKLMDGFNRILLNCFLLSLFFVICFTGNLMIFRLTAYFDLSTTLLIPYLLKYVRFSKRTRIVLYSTIGLLGVFLFFRNIILFDNGDFFAYRFFFL